MQITKLTTEQSALAESAREVLAKESNPSHVRALTEEHEPFDRRLWQLAGQLGWHGLEVTESLGGSEQTFLETSLILRELGRATTPGPYLSQQLALHALTRVPDHPVSSAWIERLAAGDAVGAVLLGTLGRDGATRAALRARSTGGSALIVTGTAPDVPDVGHADVLVLSAVREGEPLVLAAERSALPLTTTWRPTHDRTRSLFDVEAEDNEIDGAAVLASGAEAERLLDDLWQRAATGTALDGVGGAAKALQMTVSYTSQRVQYGRPIATFQAVKHTCADMFVESEVARIAADAATLEIAANGPRRGFWASVAKFRACDAYSQVAGDALQMHGGIGMTWEFDLHFWLKRAKLNQALYGSSDAHRARVAIGL